MCIRDRAHDIEVSVFEAAEGEGGAADCLKVTAQLGANDALMQVDHLLEQQFESELVLRPLEGDGILRVLMDKKRAEAFSREKMLRVHIPDHALLLLTCLLYTSRCV